MAIFSPMTMELNAGQQGSAPSMYAAQNSNMGGVVQALANAAKMALLKKRLEAEEARAGEELGFKRQSHYDTLGEKRADRLARGEESRALREQNTVLNKQKMEHETGLQTRKEGFEERLFGQKMDFERGMASDKYTHAEKLAAARALADAQRHKEVLEAQAREGNLTRQQQRDLQAKLLAARQREGDAERELRLTDPNRQMGGLKLDVLKSAFGQPGGLQGFPSVNVASAGGSGIQAPPPAPPGATPTVPRLNLTGDDIRPWLGLGKAETPRGQAMQEAVDAMRLKLRAEGVPEGEVDRRLQGLGTAPAGAPARSGYQADLALLGQSGIQDFPAAARAATSNVIGGDVDQRGFLGRGLIAKMKERMAHSEDPAYMQAAFDDIAAKMVRQYPGVDPQLIRRVLQSYITSLR